MTQTQHVTGFTNAERDWKYLERQVNFATLTLPLGRGLDRPRWSDCRPGIESLHHAIKACIAGVKSEKLAISGAVKILTIREANWL